MTAFDFSENLSRFANTRGLRIARHGGYTMSGGVAGGSTWSIVTIDEAFVVPHTRQEQDERSGGLRLRGEIRIYVHEGIEGAKFQLANGSRLADVIEWHGHLWQVDMVSDWSEAGALMEAIAVKLDGPFPTLEQFIAHMEGS